jgi:hypothetical protein
VILPSALVSEAVPILKWLEPAVLSLIEKDLGISGASLLETRVDELAAADPYLLGVSLAQHAQGVVLEWNLATLAPGIQGHFSRAIRPQEMPTRLGNLLARSCGFAWRDVAAMPLKEFFALRGAGVGSLES